MYYLSKFQTNFFNGFFFQRRGEDLFAPVNSGKPNKFIYNLINRNYIVIKITKNMSGLFSALSNKYVLTLSTAAGLAGLAALVKDSMQGPRFTKQINADGKVVIITGANTGIGKETARDLAKRNAHIYMACRDLTRCEEARKEIQLATNNKNVYCRECDLASFQSIRDFARKFQSEEKRLDILINNAGVMRCPRNTTKDGIEMQMGVNHFGHFLLTNLLLDLLKKSAPSRIVVVSSIAHKRGQINVVDLNSEQKYDEGDAYSQSKLANVLFAKELSSKLQGTGVTVNSLHPGVVDTEIVRHMWVFNSILTRYFIKPLFWPFVKSSKFGAQTTLYAALDPDLTNKTGLYFSDCAEAEVSEAATDDKIAKWLWKVSEKWTGCTFT